MTFTGTEYLSDTTSSSNLFIGTGDWTITARVLRAAAASGSTTILDTQSGFLNGLLLLGQASGACTLYIMDASTSQAFSFGAGTLPADDTEYNLVIRSTSNTVQLYRDGVKQGSDKTQTLTPTVQTASAHNVGRRGDTAAIYWKGEINEIRLYNGYAFTDADIATHCNSYGSDNIVNGLRLRLVFNEGATGTTATIDSKDLSTYGLDFTPASSPVYNAYTRRIK